MKYIGLVLLAVALYAPTFAHAETVLRVGDNISVDAQQVVDGNYYVSVGPFGTTNMSGNVKGDMYALGGMVTTNGPIGSDLSILSASTQVHATVAGDVRVLGGEVTIADHVGGDLFVIGGSLQVLSTATIDGNVYFFGGDAVIDGKVAGSVMGSAKQMRINSEIGKDVDVTLASGLTLGEKAVIDGSVRYASPQKIVRAQNASVNGEVSQNAYVAKDAQSASERIKQLLVPLFIMLFAALSLYLLFRKELTELTLYIQRRTVRCGLVGLGILVLGPIASVLLMITVLGSLVGVICLAFTILVCAVGFSVSGILLGSYLSLLFTKKNAVTLPWLFAGTFGIGLCACIPVVGPLVVVAFTAITSGGIVLCTYKLLS